MSSHTDVAAYSLGLLDPQDRLEFEAHLTDCESCAGELADFVGLAELLAGVGPVEAEPDEAEEAGVVELISRRAIARRHQARQRLVLAAAAGLVVLGGGVAAGMATAPGPVPRAVRPAGQAHSATDQLTGASGTVHLLAMPYGTKIVLDLSGVHGPLTCQLVAVSKTGQRAIAAGWQVPATGYGIPGQPTRLVITGGTAIMPGDLARVVIDVVGGGTLLSIPI